MEDKKHSSVDNEVNENQLIIDKAKNFWAKSGKTATIVLGALALLIAAYFAYTNFVKKPKEVEAADKSFKAEDYFRMDSVNKALNGDGVNPGFIKIASNYSGTAAGNLAKYYAGVCYIKLNQNAKAVEYLKDFTTSSKQVQQRAFLLLGDAYGDLGKPADALEYYKRAAHHFETDQQASSEALFRGAFLAQHVLNKPDQAIELFKELKQKYPRTQQGFEADKYLAQLGVYNIN